MTNDESNFLTIYNVFKLQFATGMNREINRLKQSNSGADKPLLPTVDGLNLQRKNGQSIKSCCDF